MPADHVGILVPLAKLEDVVKFLSSALGFLGFRELYRPFPSAVGMGEGDFPYLWLSGLEGADLDAHTFDTLTGRTHIAFTLTKNEDVDKFYQAAMKAGGIDNGPPGHRDWYHPGYYGAFVRDPGCGINFEAVNHNGQKRGV